MKINKLFINNFRNIKSISLEPVEGINVIFGDNAQGKTNLIEAIWMFTGAKSFRGNKDNELVLLNNDFAEIKAEFESCGVKKDAEISIELRRTYFLSGNKLSSPSKAVGEFNAVVFSPDDLEIVSAGPSVRRKFLDIAISQIYPSYLDYLRKYNKALKQRNSVLKEIKTSGFQNDLVSVFELEMVNNARKIIKIRKRYIEKCSEIIKIFYSGLSNNTENLTMNYQIAVEPDYMLSSLEQSRHKDIMAGTSGLGPHKDDISFCINGMDARTFASQGQKRSIAVALKLTEAEIINNSVGEQPVLLLDDVMSELDENRQDYILNRIVGRQVFITCCDTANTQKLKIGRVFKIEKGKLV